MKFVGFGERYITCAGDYMVVDTNTLRVTMMSGSYIYNHARQFENVICSQNGNMYLSFHYQIMTRIGNLWRDNLSLYEPYLYMLSNKNTLFIWSMGVLYRVDNMYIGEMPIIVNNYLKVFNMQHNYQVEIKILTEMTLQEYKRILLLDKSKFFDLRETGSIKAIRLELC